IEASAGAPSSTRGTATAAHLGRGALSQTTVEFAFDDLRARVVATNMGHGKYVVRELYQSLRS
ncbi:MAG: hypothetical protein IAG13_29840, partial [Deltaproteobacteria bacterium]|nr:hypothetical protein [Nannocystaceae bacterium]